MLLRQPFFFNTVFHRITDNNIGTRWPRSLIAFLLCLVFVYISVLKIIALFEFSLFFWLFSKDSDLWPVLWRYSLCFSSLMVFSWSSTFLFEELWLMILTSLIWLVSLLTCLYCKHTKILKYWMCHQSPIFLSPYYRHCSSGVLLLLWNLLIISFSEQISFLRNSIYFFKCVNYSSINESLIFFFVVQV